MLLLVTFIGRCYCQSHVVDVNTTEADVIACYISFLLADVTDIRSTILVASGLLLQQGTNENSTM